MVVYRLEIANTKYDHNGIVCGITDCLDVVPDCLSYGNATDPDPKKQELIDLAHECIDQLGDPDSTTYIPVPYLWSTSETYYCFFTVTGIRRCMEQLVNLIHICMETGHPVVLWSTDTSSFGEEEVVHSDPYQVVICVTDESEWGSKIKNLFNFTSEKSANAAMRFIVA